MVWCTILSWKQTFDVPYAGIGSLLFRWKNAKSPQNLFDIVGKWGFKSQNSARILIVGNGQILTWKAGLKLTLEVVSICTSSQKSIQIRPK